MTTACDAHALAISSSATTYETVSAPLPPQASGTVMPSRPSSPMRLTVSCGKRASRSISEAMGATCSCANSRAMSRIIACSSVSSILMIVPTLALLFFQQLLELVGERGHHLEEVRHDAVVGDLEDRRLRVLVDRDDDLRRPHASEMLNRTGNAKAEVELGRDGAARLSDLEAMRPPSRVDCGARSADGGADPRGHLFEDHVVLGALHAAPPRDDGLGLGQLRQPGRDLLAPLDELMRDAGTLTLGFSTCA